MIFPLIHCTSALEILTMYTSLTSLCNSRCPFHLSLLLSYGSYTSPSCCLSEYNSQIMSSSVMYSQRSVCVDLRAPLPPSRTHTARSAPGTKSRLHLVSQTTKSVRGSLALLLYSVINGREHPPPRCLCTCVLVSN